MAGFRFKLLTKIKSKLNKLKLGKSKVNPSDSNKSEPAELMFDINTYLFIWLLHYVILRDSQNNFIGAVFLNTVVCF